MSSDWDQRQLCPDGGCTGVISDDGTCKVCGRVAPNWGDERRRGKRTTLEVESEPAAPAQVIEPEPIVTAGDADDLEHRALCPDGGCIGVIGADGKCKVCGRAA